MVKFIQKYISDNLEYFENLADAFARGDREEALALANDPPYHEFRMWGVNGLVHGNGVFVYGYNARGVRGGSCWGNDGQHSYVAEDYEIPEAGLATAIGLFILEKSTKPVTFGLMAKTIRELDNITTMKVYEDREYYGNWTEKKIFYVDFDKLWDICAELL